VQREGDGGSRLKFYMRELARLTGRLRLLASIVLGVTSVNFLTSLTIIVTLASSRYWDYWFVIQMAVIPISLTVLAIGAIWLYERCKREGAVLYEELSEEFEWRISTRVQKPGREEDDVADLDARVTLRLYAAMTDLWFAPGRLGIAAYTVLNLGLALFVVSAAVAQLRD